MINLITELENLINEKLELTSRSGLDIIKPTLRSQIKKSIEEAIIKDFEAVNENADIEIGYTADGIIISVFNETLDRKNINNGQIPIGIEIKMKNLDYILEDEIDSYEATLAEKAEKEKSKAKAKASKIKRDAESRAEDKQAQKAKKSTSTDTKVELKKGTSLG